MKNRNIFCLDYISKSGTNCFRQGYNLVDSIDEADGVLVRSSNMREMNFPARLKAIVRVGAGVNNIPLKQCAEQGIVVFNTPGANANSVKELVLAALFLASRDIIGANEWVRANSSNIAISKESERIKRAFVGNEIKGKILGIIGLGAIGMKVADAAIALGMEVLGYDPYILSKSDWNANPYICYVDDINCIYEKSDFITIHTPVTDLTKGIINEEAILRMKEGVNILNFARDILVDENAMKNGLESGKVAKYISDFPNPLNASLKNAIILPHIGASTIEAEDNCSIMAVKQMQEYLDYGNITNSVNYPMIGTNIDKMKMHVLLLYKNEYKNLSDIMKIFKSNDIILDGFVSKEREGYACFISNLVYEIPSSVIAELCKLEGVIRVRQFIM